MFFYQVTDPETGVKQLVRTQDEARKIDRQFVKVDVPTDAKGLCAYVNEMMEKTTRLDAPPVSTEPQPHNWKHDGERHNCARCGEPYVGLQDDCREPKPVSYAELTVAFEDAFEAMPLPLKFHFAALAMEEGRSKLGN